MARSRTSLTTNRPAFRFAACLALLLLALRSVVPVGYMPDAGALKEGQVRIVICDPSGLRALFVDEAGQPIEDTGGAGHAAAEDCGFAIAAMQTFIAPVADWTLDGAYGADAIAAAGGPAGQASRNHGPPLGSRAPPVSLA